MAAPKSRKTPKTVGKGRGKGKSAARKPATRKPRSAAAVPAPHLALHHLKPPAGSHRPALRVGRGPGSGLGKTAGRGQKGQRARAGGRVRPGFEGGQMPLIRRIPKRGFTNPFRTPAQVVNVRHLGLLAEGVEVTPETLFGAGLVRRTDAPIKLLGMGDVARRFVVRGVAVSASARGKIEQAGGTIEG